MGFYRDDHKNPGVKRPYFEIPGIVDEIEEWCKIEICIPNDDDYRRQFHDALTLLSMWFNFERTGDNKGKRVADVWKQIRDATDLLGSCEGGDCGCGDDGGCNDKMSDCGACGDD